MMNTQNNPIKQSSVLSAAGVTRVMILKLIALSLFGISGAYAEEALFVGTSSVVSNMQLQSSPEIKRSQVVTLNPKSIALDERSPDKTQQAQIVLNLFDNVSFKTKLDSVKHNSPGNYTIHGKVEGMPSSDVLLTSVNGVLTGVVITEGGFYEIRNVEKDQYAVYEIDQTKFPNEDSHPLPESARMQANIASSMQITPNATVQAATDDGSIIDVLVVYTTAAKTAAGGVNQILGTITTAVNQTNLAYSNSQVKQRFRLVGTMETNYTETTVNDALFAVINMSDVKARRDALGADMVVLMTETTAGISDQLNTCGDAWQFDPPIKDYMYSIVPRTCATANYSFAHVTALNLGADQDCDNDPNSTLPNIYNHGYVNAAKGWRTIMAYNTQCPSCVRIQYFSNPAVKYPNDSTGTPTGTNTGTCQANVKAALDDSALAVSQHYNGYCDLTGYVGRANVYPAASVSNLFLRPTGGVAATNPPNNTYLSFNTADSKLIDVGVKALTHRTLVAVRGNKSCIPGVSPPYNYGGEPNYLLLAP